MGETYQVPKFQAFRAIYSVRPDVMEIATYGRIVVVINAAVVVVLLIEKLPV